MILISYLLYHTYYMYNLYLDYGNLCSIISCHTHISHDIFKCESHRSMFSNITFHDHISDIISLLIFICLIKFGRIMNILTFDATAHFILSLIVIYLDLCNLPNNRIDRLQRIQTQAAILLKRMIRIRPFVHVQPLIIVYYMYPS